MPVKTGARVDGSMDSYWLISAICISYNPQTPPTTSSSCDAARDSIAVTLPDRTLSVVQQLDKNELFYVILLHL
jgi:hypothetical protein